MSIMKSIVVYVSMAVLLILIEYLWLGILASEFYHKELAQFMSRDVNWVAVIPFYLIYVTGILIFAVLPSHAANSLTKALSLGAMLGVFAFATLNLTNLALLRDWPISVVAVDLAWGTLLTCITAAIGFIIAQKLS